MPLSAVDPPTAGAIEGEGAAAVTTDHADRENAELRVDGVADDLIDVGVADEEPAVEVAAKATVVVDASEASGLNNWDSTEPIESEIENAKVEFSFLVNVEEGLLELLNDDIDEETDLTFEIVSSISEGV
jgi:hypothetical protein